MNKKQKREYNNAWYAKQDKTYFDRRNAKFRERYRKNPEEHKNYVKAYRLKNPNHAKDWANKYPHRYWAMGVIKSHKKVGYIVKITYKELEKVAKSTVYCQFCNVILKYGRGGHLTNSASIDRTNNGKKLTSKNTCIICITCNTTKGSKTFNEFVCYCNMIAKSFFKSSKQPFSIKDASSVLSGL